MIAGASGPRAVRGDRDTVGRPLAWNGGRPSGIAFGMLPVRRATRLALTFAAAALLAGCDAATSIAARAGFGGSFEERCEKRLPATRIDVIGAPVVYDTDRSRSYRELTTMSGDAEPGRRALGLTTAQIGHTAFLETAGIEDTRSGRVCVRPAIRVELTMTPMTVYVGRELADDPCREAVILEHEMKHVAVYTQHLADVSDAVRDELVTTYGNTIYYFRDRAEAQQQAEAGLAQRLSARLADSARRVKELQAAVDSPEEYARVTGACGGMQAAE